jgi:proton glutamate symport protein
MKKIFSSLTAQIFIGLVLGVFVGWLFPDWGKAIKPVSDIFLRMIKMIIAPLIFATLVIGIAGAGNFRKIGRIGLKTIVYFEIVTTLALFIGLVVANVVKPGEFISRPALNAGQVAPSGQPQPNDLAGPLGSEFIVNIFPTSVVDAMAKGNMLQLVVFSVFFGLALAAAGEKGKPLFAFLEALAETMFRFTRFVMKFAPLGVMAAVAATVGDQGLGVLKGYAGLIAAFYGALIIFVLGVLLTVCVILKIPFLRLVKTIREPVVLAFTTASSEAAMPAAMKSMETFGCPRSIVGFVIPAGYSFNLDGGTLYLSLACVFIAQAFGVPLDVKTQIAIMLTLIISSKGLAGVPRAALVVLAGTAAAFGLPMEGIALLIGIDHILDMGRTAVNVLGNCVATAVVARWEGVLQNEATTPQTDVVAPG